MVCWISNRGPEPTQRGGPQATALARAPRAVRTKEWNMDTLLVDLTVSGLVGLVIGLTIGCTLLVLGLKTT